jgi:hypothetical protein
MARLLWFALGAAAGMAYASQLVHKERLDLPPGLDEIQARELASQPQEPKVPFKVKVADMIDMRADQIANMLDQAVMNFTEKLHVKGHELAAKMRGQEGMEAIGMPGTVTIYGEAFLTETPGSQEDTGLEANR